MGVFRNFVPFFCVSSYGFLRTVFAAFLSVFYRDWFCPCGRAFCCSAVVSCRIDVFGRFNEFVLIFFAVEILFPFFVYLVVDYVGHFFVHFSAFLSVFCDLGFCCVFENKNNCPGTHFCSHQLRHRTYG